MVGGGRYGVWADIRFGVRADAHERSRFALRGIGAAKRSKCALSRMLFALWFWF